MAETPPEPTDPRPTFGEIHAVEQHSAIHPCSSLCAPFRHAMGVKLRGGRVVAEGHWDARGTLGVDREAPVGLTDIALTFELDTDADTATVRRLVEMSERFCVIYQTLRAPPGLSVTHRIVAGA